MQEGAQEAISDKWARWRLPTFAIAILVIVVLPFVFLYSVVQDSQDATRRVDHTRQVESTIHSLSSAIRNSEAATLALASGIDTPLVRERLATGTAQIPVAFEQLTSLTVDNPSQQLRIGELKAVLDQRRQLVGAIATSTGLAERRSDAEEIVTRYPVQTIAEDIVAEERHLLAGRVASAERLRRQGDVLLWVMMAAQLLLLGTLIYLSESQARRRIHIEQQARRTSARSQAILQSVREPIVVIDDEQLIVMHNAAFADLYVDPDNDTAIIGQPLADIGEGAWHDPVMLQRLADVFARDRELWDYEQRQRTRDDTERVMLVNARRMQLPGSEDRVVLLTVSDISAHKATENHVRELNRQLEGKVAQVSEVNRELEAFSYSVSHDLRAPLRHIAGFSDKLGRHLGEAADDKSRHYIEVIGSSAKRMATLIDDLLVYSRLGRSAMRLQAVDMQSMAVETRALLDANVTTDTPDRRIEWRIAPLPIVIGDENMLRQVWLNLLGNAVKYSARRTPAIIEVSHERTDDGGHHFSVRDNGAGFDMQYASKLFGVFQRMHKASEYPGTGIGLASVRRVLVRHGGRVWAEAEPEAGATFHFTLPATLDNSSIQETTA
ncbi:ATP-binding protein [Lysobacter sp. F6437]|uniref:ATP-binding protein n=1 Tax=Lysobacter sp. F6437 TaxID=3459296 RepID=UPI00403DB433